jgi:4,5-dihydroxyphthalate decarboxylase
MNLLAGIGRYDRTAPLLEGLVKVKGTNTAFESPPLEELFARSFDKGEYDIAELSFSNYVYLTSEGGCGYVGLPIFPSRTFRHAAIYIRTDRGIRSPRDLIGRVVGVREFSMTAALMARGALEDDFGVSSSDIRWRYGPAESYDSKPIVRMQPRGVETKPIADGENLSDLLRDGKIDALVAYKPPSCFKENAPHVRRLFPDHVAAERDYYARTGIFPIMHLIGIRRELAQQQPGLCLAVCDAFEEAKRLAFEALEAYQYPAVSLPWPQANLAEARELMGEDFWPYGVAPNRTAIEAVTRYSAAQGLASRELRMDELFAQNTLEWLPS